LEEYRLAGKKASEKKPWLVFWGEDLPEEREAECTTYQYLYERNKNCCQDIALRYFGRKITYGELFQQIQKAAGAFRLLHVKKGDIVTICSVMTPETVYMTYALDLLGATANMIDPRTSAEGMREYIEEVDSQVVCTLQAAYPKIQEATKKQAAAHVVVISPDDSLPPVKRFAYRMLNKDQNRYDSNVLMWGDFVRRGGAAKATEGEPYDPERAAIIVHTGGTTGVPKGVMLGDKALNALAMQMQVKRLERRHRMLNIMPPFIAYGFANGVHLPLSYGAEVILIPRFEASKFGALLRKYHTEHVAGVPLHYQMLIRDPKMKDADLSFLISTGCGGDGISLGAEDEVNGFLEEHHSPYKLCKGYGMTEVASTATVSVREINKKGSVGIPLFMTNIGIFKPGTDEELDFNTEGEICISGPNVMLGYYGKPEETAKIKLRHRDGQDWIHSGDIGWMDEEGFVFVSSRIKRLIIRHDGFKVFPSAIENVISRHPDVEVSCAVATKDPDHKQGDLPFVYLQLRKEREASQDNVKTEVAELCTRALAEYAVPLDYEFVEHIPYTPIGKVDYLKLEALRNTQKNK